MSRKYLGKAQKSSIMKIKEFFFLKRGKNISELVILKIRIVTRDVFRLFITFISFEQQVE